MASAAGIDRAGEEARVLSTAVSRIATLWRLSNEQLGAILGLSSASASRLRGGGYRLEPGSKPFELGQYLVRLFRSLDALMGSDDEASASWLRTVNLDLGVRPIDRIRSIAGLIEVTDHVDGHRARV